MRAMDGGEARRLFASAGIARLGTVGADGAPHLVPICFAVEGDRIYSAVDHKPKRTDRLRRLANIAANPRVSMLVDHYEDDWSKLWWVRADGVGRVAAPGVDQHARAVELLGARYEQYRQRPLAGTAIVISVSRWSGWKAA